MVQLVILIRAEKKAKRTSSVTAGCVLCRTRFATFLRRTCACRSIRDSNPNRLCTTSGSNNCPWLQFRIRRRCSRNFSDWSTLSRMGWNRNTEARRACYRLGRRTRCRCERTPDRCSCTCRPSRGRCGFRTATRCCNRLRNTWTRTCPTKRLERRCTRFGHLGRSERRVCSDRFQRSRSSRTSASCRRIRWDGRAGGRCGCRTP